MAHHRHSGSGNEVTDEGAARLAKALQHNNTLIRLDFQGNREEGMGRYTVFFTIFCSSTGNKVKELDKFAEAVQHIPDLVGFDNSCTSVEGRWLEDT